MLNNNQLSLARQVDMVFRELESELSGLTSGTVFIQIRNNVVGKFGIRHNPISGRNGRFAEGDHGLTQEQCSSFRNMAIASLDFKRAWTHGEISYEFALRQQSLIVDATLESNYNMANLMIRYPRTPSSHTYQEMKKDLS
ncbi:O-methyltransferase [Paenibacillus sp. CAA11]|uniref:O-methyltransferase n=1 Tax=Paenibacillus sp. CAA11 TaxID=1532905 RepID=UPI000D3BC798|nr:O-methyltransferase [Paenibacillus sp. CAA11]AWB45904.1 O-methyltransferase [Paenibacillus sp. CAA11]